MARTNGSYTTSNGRGALAIQPRDERSKSASVVDLICSQTHIRTFLQKCSEYRYSGGLREDGERDTETERGLGIRKSPIIEGGHNRSCLHQLRLPDTYTTLLKSPLPCQELPSRDCPSTRLSTNHCKGASEDAVGSPGFCMISDSRSRLPCKAGQPCQVHCRYVPESANDSLLRAIDLAPPPPNNTVERCTLA